MLLFSFILTKIESGYLTVYTTGNKNEHVKCVPILRHMNQKTLGHQQALFSLHAVSFSATLLHTGVFHHFNPLNYGNGYQECKLRVSLFAFHYR